MLGFVFQLNAQFVVNHLVSLEGGASSMVTDIPNADFIRGNVPIDQWESVSNVNSSLNRQFGGIKYEYLTMHNKMGISTGVRFSRQTGVIGRNDDWDSGDFFYLKYSENGQNTEYFKINGITQTTDYVGFPLEIRFFPYRASFLRMYFKAGMDFNYKLQSKTNVQFSNPDMDAYENDVKALFREPKSFMATSYFTGGLRFGREYRPTVNIEAMLPTWTSDSKSTGMLRSYAGVGFMVNVQVPINARQIEEASQARQVAAEQARVEKQKARAEKERRRREKREQKLEQLEQKEDVMPGNKVEEKQTEDKNGLIDEKRKEELINMDNDGDE